jgi:type II secretory pathway pseudopilin PulG
MPELIVVVVVLGMLGALVGLGYSGMTRRTERSAAEQTVRTVVLAEQLRFRSRGQFAADPAVLATLEPDLTFVAAPAASTDPGTVSVSAGTFDGLPAVGVAVRSRDDCVVAVVVNPDLGDPVTGRFVVDEFFACTGDDAFLFAGELSW